MHQQRDLTLDLSEGDEKKCCIKPQLRERDSLRLFHSPVVPAFVRDMHRQASIGEVPLRIVLSDPLLRRG